MTPRYSISPAERAGLGMLATRLPSGFHRRQLADALSAYDLAQASGTHTQQREAVANLTAVVDKILSPPTD